MSAGQTENIRKIAEVVMRSLNSMIAEFGRGKDKKKRRNRLIRNAAIAGALLPGAALGVYSAIRRPSSLRFYSPQDAGLIGALSGTYLGAIPGALAGAGAGYYLSRQGEKNKSKRFSVDRFLGR